MPLQLQCPHCHRILNAPDHMAGNQAACPHCRNLLTIPPLADVMPPIAASAPGAPPVRQTAERPIAQSAQSPVRERTPSPVPGLAILSGVISIVLGIICCIVGSLGSIANYMVFSMMQESMKSAPVAGQAVDHGAKYALGATVFILFFGILLVTASIGLFSGRRWAWVLSLILVAAGAIAGGKTYSYYSRTVSQLEQQEVMAGMDQAQVAKMRTVVYPMLKVVLLVPATILIGHAILTCFLLLMPPVARRYLSGGVREPAYQSN